MALELNAAQTVILMSPPIALDLRVTQLGVADPRTRISILPLR